MNKINVLLLSKYSRKGASSRLRTMQYIPFLKSNNVCIEAKPLFDDEYLVNLYAGASKSKLAIVKYYLKRIATLFNAYKYDVIWLEKELLPYCPAFFEWLLVKLGVKYIVDYDDAIFHNYDLAKSKYARFFLGKKIDSVMKGAHTVIAGNDYLAERAKSAGAKNIVIIPTVVDTTRYAFKQKKNGEILTIGWIGSPSTQKYVVQIKPALDWLSDKYNIRILLVGATNSVVDELAGLNVVVEEWTEKTEVTSIQKMDVGIMPLQDGPWEKGKCGYKLIQYMACSVPVVASPVGVNTEIVKNANCGFLATTLDEWQMALDKILCSDSVRLSFGVNGCTMVNDKYCLQVQKFNILNCLTDTVLPSGSIQ